MTHLLAISRNSAAGNFEVDIDGIEQRAVNALAAALHSRLRAAARALRVTVVATSVWLPTAVMKHEMRRCTYRFLSMTIKGHAKKEMFDYIGDGAAFENDARPWWETDRVRESVDFGFRQKDVKIAKGSFSA